jgi:hypothetical protein
MATKARSPNYPQISLPKAVDLAAKLYEAAHTHKASATAVVNALGYGGLNGKSLGVISALKKYGLLESVGDNEFKVSKDALTILVDPKTSVERARTIVRAAFRPSLFAELRQEYGDSPPKSDDYIRAFLLKRGFVQSVVDVPIRTYRDTMALVQQVQELAGDVPLAPPTTDEDDDDMIASTPQAAPTLVVATIAAAADSMPMPSAADMRDDVYKLPDGRAFVLRWPAKLSAEEYEDFEAWISLLQRKLKRQIE